MAYEWDGTNVPPVTTTSSAPVEAEPSAGFPVAHDGSPQVHQPTTPVNDFVQLTLGFCASLQDSGEPAHPHILAFLQALHLRRVWSCVLHLNTDNLKQLIILFW